MLVCCSLAARLDQRVKVIAKDLLFLQVKLEELEQMLRSNPQNEDLQVLITTDGLNIFHIAVNMTPKDILRQVVTNFPGKDGIHNHVLS